MVKVKADKLETLRRIETARQLLLEGHDSTRVAREIAKRFGIGERQAWNYISKAQEEIRNVGEVELAYRRAEHIAVRREMRQRAKRAGDLRVELEIVKDEAKLLGVYPADQHVLKAKIETVEHAGELLQSRIDSIAARFGATDDSGGTGSDK